MAKVKKNILILGAAGMLGLAICKCLKAKYKIIPLAHQDCDITDQDKLFTAFRRYKPWVVINSAAYKDVDGCEADKPRAYAVNAEGNRNVSLACRASGSVLIYISSDYVFDGRHSRPYREIDKPHPLSIYGKSKLKGEEFTRSLLKKYIIIRTSWIFGKGGPNFIDDILRRARAKRYIPIVNDKFASPTYAQDLAAAILEIINMINGSNWQEGYYGVYHLTNSGFCSWYDYAKAVFKFAKLKGTRLKPIGLDQINFLARRPVFSALDNSKYIRLTNKPLRSWQKAVEEYLKDTGQARSGG